MGKMKKKTVSMALAAVLSGVVLVTTALAASNNVSGYEKLKASAFNIMTMENYTVTADYALKFDGVDFSTGTMDAKVQDSTHSSEISSTTTMGETDTSESYTMGDVYAYKMYDGNYYARQNYGGYSDFGGLEMSDNEKKLVSTIFDMLAGDTKNYFTNKDGEISVQLERSQIPEFFQALMAVASEGIKEEMSYYYDEGYDYYGDDFEYQIFSLMNDMNFNAVSINAFVDENDLLNKMEFSVTISGKDENGTEHFATLELNCYIKDIGTTVADTIDLTGKNVTYSEYDPFFYDDFDFEEYYGDEYYEQDWLDELEEATEEDWQ